MTVGADLPPGGQTGEPAPVIPLADPAYADTSLPLPPFPGRTSPEAAAEFSFWSTCEIETLLVVLILTLCVSLWLVLLGHAFKRFKQVWAEFRNQTGQASGRGRR